MEYFGFLICPGIAFLLLFLYYQFSLKQPKDPYKDEGNKNGVDVESIYRGPDLGG